MEVRYPFPDVTDFLSGLPRPLLAKVLRIIDILEKKGHGLRYPFSKPLMKNLFELRADDVRLFYIFHEGAVCLLVAIQKKSDRIPARALVLALARKKALAGI